MKKDRIWTLDEWLGLKQLPIPIVSRKGQGTIFEVLKSGMFAGDPKECERKNVPVEMNEVTKKCHLPTIYIRDKNGGETLYRLPVDMIAWVETLMGLAMDGTKLLPSKVELGLENDRYYADFV